MACNRLCLSPVTLFRYCTEGEDSDILSLDKRFAAGGKEAAQKEENHYEKIFSSTFNRCSGCGCSWRLRRKGRR